MRRAPLLLLITVLTGSVLHTANVRSDDNIKFTQIFDGKTLHVILRPDSFADLLPHRHQAMGDRQAVQLRHADPVFPGPV